MKPLACRNHPKRRPTRHLTYVDGHGIRYDFFLCRECDTDDEPVRGRARRCDGQCGAGEAYHASLLANPDSEWSRL